MKEIKTRKLNEHVEEELFNKDKRKKNQDDFLSEESKSKIVKTITDTGEYVVPVKKKKPYYRKKYNKPKPIEIGLNPKSKYTFLQGVGIGLIIGILISVISTLIT